MCAEHVDGVGRGHPRRRWCRHCRRVVLFPLRGAERRFLEVSESRRPHVGSINVFGETVGRRLNVVLGWGRGLSGARCKQCAMILVVARERVGVFRAPARSSKKRGGGVGDSSHGARRKGVDQKSR